MNTDQEIQAASEGHGPLWQRNYSARIAESTLAPEDVIAMLRVDFAAFSPTELAAFSRDESTPLQVGDEMKVFIQGYGECAVRCVHLEPCSFTLRTLEGHFEAGRITFGAYHEDGNLLFRICSRARSVDRLRHVGYKIVGHKMQEQTWVVFAERVAEKTGGKLIGEIEVETEEVQSTLADIGELDVPTFAVSQ